MAGGSSCHMQPVALWIPGGCWASPTALLCSRRGKLGIRAGRTAATAGNMACLHLFHPARGVQNEGLLPVLLWQWEPDFSVLGLVSLRLRGM